MKTRIMFVALLITSVMLWSCGEASGENAKQPVKTGANAGAGSNAAKSNPSGLNTFQLEHGVGPITAELKLAAVNATLAKTGEKIFETKCFSCHRLDDRYVGPPLREVTKRRKPEYVVNMILNPDEMIKKHPDAKKLLAEYMTPMTFQNVTKDEAMAILEYFRYSAEQKKK
ncbi:cytochrome c [bacterium]|nr:cytochrome c [bacterium]